MIFRLARAQDFFNKLEEFGVYKTGYFKTCKLCREKLGLPSARNNSIIISNQQTNKSKESCENDTILSTSEDDILLHDIIELEDLEDFISTEIEAYENNSIGIETTLGAFATSITYLNAKTATYLLQEDESYSLLYSNQENELFEFAFTTPFLQLLYDIYDEICMDATYKTNNTGFELYTVMANIEGVSYPLSYLFLNSSPTTPNMRTMALTDYLYALQKQE
ncbi:5235_t:CDS:2, partial [Ambispora gerdemannii]